MKVYLRNALAVIVGFFIGGIVNMCLVKIGHALVPPPEGYDLNTAEGVKAAMKVFTPKDFLFPFLAHAVGTLAGAFAAGKLAVSRKLAMSLVIGVMFMLCGLMMISMVGGPQWFVALDLLGAYLPMGYLGGRLALGRNRVPVNEPTEQS